MEILARSSLPARVSDKRLKCFIKLLPLCKDAVTINIYSLAVIELVKTMCRPVGPVHFGRHCDARRTQKSVFGVHMISADALPNGSTLEVFTDSDLGSAPSPDGPRCKQRDSGKADVGSALMRKKRESQITHIHAGAAWHPSPAAFPSGDDGLMCTSRFLLEVVPMFQLLKMTGEEKCKRRRLCVLSLVCTECITFNLQTAERCYTFTLDMMLIPHSYRQNCLMRIA